MTCPVHDKKLEPCIFDREILECGHCGWPNPNHRASGKDAGGWNSSDPRYGSVWEVTV